MTTGVFNPFKKKEAPKKAFVAATDAERPRDTEYEGRAVRSTIRLDGDSYVLKLDDLELVEVPQRLEHIFSALMPQYRADLETAGVFYYTRDNIPDSPNKHLKLMTPHGCLIVYAGDNGKEIDCYRRLAYALYGLPIKQILAKYNASVYKRG